MKMGGASHTGTQPHTHTHKHSHTTVSALVVAAGRQAGDAAPALESAGRLHEHRHSAAGISRRKGALAVRLVFVCVCVCMTHVHLAFPLFPLSLFPFSPFPLSSFPLSSCPFPLSSFPFLIPPPFPLLFSPQLQRVRVLRQSRVWLTWMTSCQSSLRRSRSDTTAPA